MAGFTNSNNKNVSFLKRGVSVITGPLKKILKAGQDYDDLIIRNKIAPGIHEAALRNSTGGADEDEIYIANTYDINASKNKAIGFYQKDFASQRNYMQKMALHREISKFLDILSDEAIVYDSNNYFAHPNVSLLDDLAKDKEEEIKNKLQDNFEYIYTKVFDFKESSGAWRFFRQFLIDGIIAFQLVYDKTGRKILKAIPIDAALMRPIQENVDGSIVSGWELYPGDSQLRTFLPDTHVVYISYGKGITINTMSYVQSLIRSFNLYRTIENTAVIWNIMNSSFRLKMIVPVAGGKGKNEQTIGHILARFREEVVIDSDSGEVKIDGQPQLNLFRNYVLASKNGQQTTIESMKFDGADMSSPELLKYWRDKLWEDSQIPFARLQKDSSNPFSQNTDGFEREEMRFGKFISRLRSDFQELLVKPLYIQMFLDYPDLEDDYFKSKVGLKFNKENMFEEFRQRELMLKDIEFISAMRGFLDEDGTPYWDLDLLMEKFGNINSDLILKNKEMKKEKEKKAKKDGAPAEDMGADLDLGLGGAEQAPAEDLGLDLNEPAGIANTPTATTPTTGGATGTDTTGAQEQEPLNLDLNLNI